MSLSNVHSDQLMVNLLLFKNSFILDGLFIFFILLLQYNVDSDN